MEGLAGGEIGLHIVVHRGLHHLQIGVGPAAGVVRQGQAGADAPIVVAQIGMGGVAAIVVVGIVVPCEGLIAQRTELTAQRQGHGVVAAGPEADIAAHPGGQQAGEHGIFAAGGGLAPAGLVVVVADEALVGQTVQRGGQLLRDEPRREGFRRQQDQILALEHPRVLVLAGGSAGGYIAMDRGQRAVRCGVRQRGKVDVQRVVAVVRWLRLGGVLRQGKRLIRSRQRVQRRRGCAEQGVGQLQAETGAQPEAGYGAVGIVVVGVQRGAGAKAVDGGAAQQGDGGDGGHEQQCPAAHARLLHDAAAQDDGQRQRDHGQQQKRQP